MSSVSNNWLNPFQRSYNQIKSTLIEKLKVYIPEITDFSEGNIFIILISMYSAIAEVLHYYIDNMARETFFISARRYSSLVKHSKMVDYHIHAGIPSMVDLNLYTSDNLPIESDINIPLGTKFTDNQGNSWLSTKSVVWKSGSYGIKVPLEQKELISYVDLGLSPGGTFIVQLADTEPGKYYVEGSMNLVIGDVQWQLVETFAYSGPSDKHYKVELNEDRKPYIMFGDGTNGYMPDGGLNMYCSYYVTLGSNGSIPSGSITQLPESVSNAISNGSCTNIYSSVGGSNYETFDQMKVRVPLSIRTLGVAITKQDYEDIVRSTPGVDKAFVNYICGKYLEIYITPVGGGIASEALINKTFNNIVTRKVLTTRVSVLPVDISQIYLVANITGKKSYNSSDINNSVIKALLDKYGIGNSEIGQPVRLSDLYALIDNLPMVDFLTIDTLFIKPFPKKLANTVYDLNISSFSVNSCKSKIRYIIRYESSNKFILYSEDGSFTTNINFGSSSNVIDDKNGTNLSLTINNPTVGTYSIGDIWSISILPPNVDQVSDIVTVPVFSKENINLNITETV